MYKLLSTIIALLFLTITANAQQDDLDFNNWIEESQHNIRLLPRYGYRTKTKQQLGADSIFVESMMALSDFKSRRQESDLLVQKGFQYLNSGDVRTAMYRFNQAFLMDSTNTNDYWGYGAVYMYFGKYDLTAEQYETALKKDSANAYVLTDYATIYIIKYDEENEKSIDTAISYLLQSYAVDTAYTSTLHKLSTCYYRKHNCEKALKYYAEYKAINPSAVNKDYEQMLKQNCK